MTHSSKNHISYYIKLGFVIFGVFIFFIVIKSLLLNKTHPLISPLANDRSNGSQENVFSQLFQPKPSPGNDELVNIIKAFIEKQTGSYSVYFYNLTTKSSFGINETTILDAASVNKLPILASLYYEANQGTIDLDTRLTLQQSDMQDYGTGILRYEDPGGVYSLKTLAQLMMEKSDNTAAYLLAQNIGQDRIQELINQWGLTQTDILNNKTTAKDMSMLLIKMYNKQITSPPLTEEMIGFMDDSDFENRLPALLPKDVKVYHKIGSGIGNIHDVGVILHPKTPYVLSILTNDITDETQAEAAIAQISKIVFDYMNRQI